MGAKSQEAHFISRRAAFITGNTVFVFYFFSELDSYDVHAICFTSTLVLTSLERNPYSVFPSQECHRATHEHASPRSQTQLNANDANTEKALLSHNVTKSAGETYIGENYLPPICQHSA